MAFGDFWKLFKTVVTLADDVQRYNAELKELRKDFLQLSITVQRLDSEIEHMKENADIKHENTLLQLNNTLQGFERRLPPNIDSDQKKLQPPKGTKKAIKK